MRAILKTTVTLGVLSAIAVGAYYAYRVSDARDRGQEYPFSRAPGDLVREIAGVFARDPAAPPESGAPPPAAATGTGAPEPATPAGDPDLLPRARDLYQAGDYEAALPLLYQAFSAPGASPEQPRELLARARLFLLLLEDTPRGSDLGGDPIALLTTAVGESMLVTVTDETDADIAFRKPGGIAARVPKASLRDCQVARSPAQRMAIFEQEYRRRADAAKSPPEQLDLARFCWRTGLFPHVTYLLVRALEAPGETIEAAVVAKHGEAERAAATDRLALTTDLLRHFWSRGALARRALAGHVGGSGAVAVGPSGGGDPGPEPASGIGGSTVREPRSSDPALNALLDRASAKKKEADEHYRKAQPGMDAAADHRKKAVDAYREALGLYEQVEERWGVSLDRTFREIQERLYQMLKDTPVR